MGRKEFSLKIDSFTPDTLPMARLAEYLQQFAALLGHEDCVHFRKLVGGSALLVADADSHAEPKITRRLSEVVDGTAPRSALKARKTIDDLLAADNAIGHVSVAGAIVLEFQGRRRAEVERIGPVRRQTSIEGQIFQIGGKDATINIHLVDGPRLHRCVVSVDLAKKLAQHFLGSKVRIVGEGDFYRQGEEWVVSNFVGRDFVLLSEQSLHDSIDGIRSLFRDVDGPDMNRLMSELRNG